MNICEDCGEEMTPRKDELEDDMFICIWCEASREEGDLLCRDMEVD